MAPEEGLAVEVSTIEKGRRSALGSAAIDDQAALQDPGRYLGDIVPGPQIHVATRPPAVGAAHVPKVVAPLLEQGAILTEPSLPVPRFCEVIVTMPAASVAIDATYLLAGLVLSQPQAPAPGNVPVVDCTDSVIDVRQAEPARTTSETLALTV